MDEMETLFRSITADARYLENLDWGEPRRGHPEGTVRAHIGDLERNLARFKPRLTADEFWKLKVLIHTHDTFKADATRGVPVSDPRSHASLARAFLSEFTSDADLLAIVQNHDEPYALWRRYQDRGACHEDRLSRLLTAVQDWNLFCAFLLIDGCTPGKCRECLTWFFDQIAERVPSRFSTMDILP